ncbi:MAG: fumarylacetoacetase [Candidatus Eremiobacteraeota bacterium]|nr:fumarylacetoacetase [Candidatus Eremiobacteraeota bacterium]
MITSAVHSWVDVDADSDFPIENLPYGVFSHAEKRPHIGVAIGDRILDLHACAGAGLFDNVAERAVLQASTLNALAAAGGATWRAMRQRLSDLLAADSSELRDRSDRDAMFVPQHGARMHVPVAIGDYVDFYSSLEHATNLGKIFRPDGEPLMPNWRWLPIGYHGRSSTIVIDGTPIARPAGQRKTPDASEPSVGPSRMLDIELEMGFITGPGNALGSAIPARNAREHIFGLVLVNDWSARDIQAWEYQPLGPFLGKSFATSVSPWIVTLDALEPFRVEGPVQSPAPLPYLRTEGAWNYDVTLQVLLETERMRANGDESALVATSNFKHMYWNMAQQLAHVTINGTATRPGDLYASGTISGPTETSVGSLIERTWRGTKPLKLANGETRAFLEDGDVITLRGYCERPGARRIGFGRVRGRIGAAGE